MLVTKLFELDFENAPLKFKNFPRKLFYEGKARTQWLFRAQQS